MRRCWILWKAFSRRKGTCQQKVETVLRGIVAARKRKEWGPGKSLWLAETDSQVCKAHMNDDGLPGARDIDLAGSSDVEVLEVALQLCIVCLEVEESLVSRGKGKGIKWVFRAPLCIRCIRCACLSC